jgi:hypothetical protein
MMAVARLEMLLVHIFYSQGKDLLLPVIKYSVVDLYKTRESAHFRAYTELDINLNALDFYM